MQLNKQRGLPLIKDKEMKVDTSKDEDFQNTLSQVGDVIDGKNIGTVVPVLMALLCSCAEISGMKPEKLIIYFIMSVHSHFAMPDDESIH